MTRIKKIVSVALIIAIALAVVSLIKPGWKFSLGVLVGSAVGIGDFFMIAKTTGMLKLSQKDEKTMLKFGLVFMGKSIALLVVLGLIVFVIKMLQAYTTLFGFILGLVIIPVSVFVTAFSKKQ